MVSGESGTPVSWTAPSKPLGLGAFGLSVFVLSLVQAHLVNPAYTAVVLPIALIYGGGIQIVAGIWELRNGDAFAAATFGGFGAFWVAYYLLSENFIAKLPPASIPHAVGLFLWAWALFVAYMWVASLYRSKAIMLAFTLALLALVLLAIGATGTHASITKLGGWVGIVLAAEVFYIALAELIAADAGREILPVGKPLLGRAATASEPLGAHVQTQL